MAVATLFRSLGRSVEDLLGLQMIVLHPDDRLPAPRGTVTMTCTGSGRMGPRMVTAGFRSSRCMPAPSPPLLTDTM